MTERSGEKGKTEDKANRKEKAKRGMKETNRRRQGDK
jgi:hypothetical protein